MGMVYPKNLYIYRISSPLKLWCALLVLFYNKRFFFQLVWGHVTWIIFVYVADIINRYYFFHWYLRSPKPTWYSNGQVNAGCCIRTSNHSPFPGHRDHLKLPSRYCAASLPTVDKNSSSIISAWDTRIMNVIVIHQGRGERKSREVFSEPQ